MSLVSPVEVLTTRARQRQNMSVVDGFPWDTDAVLLAEGPPACLLMWTSWLLVVLALKTPQRLIRDISDSSEPMHQYSSRL